MNGLLRYDDRATDRDWADVLATFPLFAEVNKRRLRKLVRNARFAELGRGERLGSGQSDSLYLVLSGEAKQLWPTPRSIGAGDYFGELGVLGEKPRALQIVAEDDLHLMKLARQPVLELARRHPPVAMTLLKDLGLRLRPATAS